MAFDEHANYVEQRTSSRRSAEVVVPMLLEMVQARSVVDVGSGVGAWLSVFKDSGVREVLAVDGPWVPRDQLMLPKPDFHVADLRGPIRLGREFDLAVSLEVGEHLPPGSAETYVQSLTELSSVVLFSAAIPGQGGLGHVNEQWPDYWRDLFQARGYAVIDCIRPRIWSDPRVCWWYAQNLLVYASETALASSRTLAKARAGTAETQLALVHPKLWMSVGRPLWRSIKNRVRDRLARVMNRSDHLE